MPIDPSTVGQLTMRFIDHVTEEYGPEAELVRTMVVAEVRYHDPDGETVHHTIMWDTDEQSPAAKAGLVAFVYEALTP